jgi:hypothetical protein
MRDVIALNGSFFTPHRMLQEYAIKAYGLERPPAPSIRQPVASTSVTKPTAK